RRGAPRGLSGSVIRRSADGIVGEYMTTFVQRDWPGERIPDLFYDPRALSPNPGPRTSRNRPIRLGSTMGRIPGLRTSASRLSSAVGRRIGTSGDVHHKTIPDGSFVWVLSLLGDAQRALRGFSMCGRSNGTDDPNDLAHF